MEKIKKIELTFNMDDPEDARMYKVIVDFGKNHNIQDEAAALKSFMKYLHFLSADIKVLAAKLKELH